MSIGIWQLILVFLIILVLFGGNRVSRIMTDFAKGIKSFKKEISKEDNKDDKDTDNN